MMMKQSSMRLVLTTLLIVLSLLSTGLAQNADLKSPGKLRASADQSLASGDIAGSLTLWDQVIALEPANSSNYYKRFRVYLRANRFKEALSDLNKVLDLAPQDENALSQRARLLLRLGRCLDSTLDFSTLRQVNHAHKDLSLEPQAQRCEIAVRHGDKQLNSLRNYKAAIEQYSQAIGFTIVTSSQAEQCAELLFKRAQCSFKLGDWEQTIADAGKVLKVEKDSMDALTLRGNAYYQLGELDTAKEHFRQALKFDPEHGGSKEGHRQVKKLGGHLEKAQTAMKAQQYQQAVTHLEGLIAADPQHKFFVVSAYTDLGVAHKGLGKFPQAKVAIGEVLKREPENINALRVLGEILIENEEFQEAINTLRKAHELNNGDQLVLQALQRAEAALKQSKQKDYYKILGVKRNANVRDIKRAYREKALEWHPDKHQGEEEKAKAAEKFALIAEAAEVLGDAEKRGKYDRGEEVFPNQGSDGGGGGGGFPRGHPFGGGGGPGGFPGGFQFHFRS